MTRRPLYLSDPTYQAIERIVFEHGGWLVVANSIGLTPETMKSLARSIVGRDRLHRNLLAMQRRKTNNGRMNPGDHPTVAPLSPPVAARK